MFAPFRLSRLAAPLNALPSDRLEGRRPKRPRRLLLDVCALLLVLGVIAPAPIAGTATVPHLHPKLASTSPPATCTGTQNMLTNASFEAGTVNGTPTGNWASYPASSVTETVKNDLTNGVPTAREGENYLQASTTTAGNAVEQLVSYTTSLYDSFTFSIWLKSADGSTLSGSVKIIGQVPDHAQQEPDSTPFSVAGSWTEVSAPLNVTQTGHTQIAVDIVLNTTNKTYDIDAGQLVKAGLQNASFEMNANNTSPTSWTPTGTGTNAVVYQDSSAIDGTRLLQANTTDSSGAASIYQTVSITPAANQSFTVSVWLRSINSTSLGGRLVVWGLGGTGNESGVTTFTVTFPKTGTFRPWTVPRSCRPTCTSAAFPHALWKPHCSRARPRGTERASGGVSCAGATSTTMSSSITRTTRSSNTSSGTGKPSPGSTMTRCSPRGPRAAPGSRSWMPGCGSCAARAGCTTGCVCSSERS